MNLMERERERSRHLTIQTQFTHSREMAMKFHDLKNGRAFLYNRPSLFLRCEAGENKKEIYELLIFKHSLHSPVIIL